MQAHADAPIRGKLSALRVLKEAWSSVSGLKLPVFLLLSLEMLLFAIQWIMIFSIAFFPTFEKNIQAGVPPSKVGFNFLSLPLSTILLVLGIYLTFGLVCYFITSMLTMLGIRKALGLPITVSRVFSECRKAWFNILTLFIVVSAIILIVYLCKVLTTFGIIGKLVYYALEIGSWYVCFALGIFSLPLVIMRPTTDVIIAMKTGMQKMNANWLTIITLYLVFFVLGMLSVFTLGIALIWFAPLLFTSLGICFREVYGMKTA